MCSYVKKVAAIHDISGYGRSSLTVVIPVLSAMGFYVCPLPTALLSTNTSYPDPYVADLTKHLEAILNHWQKLNLVPDTIYSGYLGSPHQCDIVIKMISDFKHDKQFVLVDPVLGDDGILYETMPVEMVPAMKKLVAEADIITPNITEACLLTGVKHDTEFSKEEIKDIIDKLIEYGPSKVVITGIPHNRHSETVVAAYNKKTNQLFFESCEYIPAEYPGTGDTFASVLCGALMQGDTFHNSVKRATDFVYKGIALTFKYESDQREGIFQEIILRELFIDNNK